MNSQLTARLGVQLPLESKNANKEKRQTKAGLELSWNL